AAADGRRRGRAESPLGAARSRHPRGGNTLRLRAGAAWVRYVAGTLQFSFPHQLRHRRAGHAALRGRPRPDMAGHAGMGRLLLSPRDGVAAPPGVLFPGHRVAPLSLRRLPPGTLAESSGALGTPSGAVVRGRSMDSFPADADARHSFRIAGEAMTRRSLLCV